MTCQCIKTQFRPLNWAILFPETCHSFIFLSERSIGEG